MQNEQEIKYFLDKMDLYAKYTKMPCEVEEQFDSNGHFSGNRYQFYVPEDNKEHFYYSYEDGRKDVKIKVQKKCEEIFKVTIKKNQFTLNSSLRKLYKEIDGKESENLPKESWEKILKLFKHKRSYTDYFLSYFGDDYYKRTQILKYVLLEMQDFIKTSNEKSQYSQYSGMYLMWPKDMELADISCTGKEKNIKFTYVKKGM